MTPDMKEGTQEDSQRLRARAWFLGARLDDRDLGQVEALSYGPRTLRAGKDGYAMLFRFGVAVLLGLTEDEERDLLALLAPRVHAPFDDPELEEAKIFVQPGNRDHVDSDGALVLSEGGPERFQVVALVLAKSTVLSHYEKRVTKVFDHVELLAGRLQHGTGRTRTKDLRREIGNVLLIQVRMVGRVEVAEKPEMTWDEPGLDRLYERLAAEYELRERDAALSRKLELIGGSAQTYLDLLHSQQSIRVEWYIVVLIVVEIAMMVYDIWV